MELKKFFEKNKNYFYAFLIVVAVVAVIVAIFTPNNTTSEITATQETKETPKKQNAIKINCTLKRPFKM